LTGRRIAIAYDCLFPYTVGGGERWYRHLADTLSHAGAEVTYLTRVQWGEPPDLPGIEVVAVSGPSELYDSEGVRRIGPGLKYSFGLLRWLLRHGDSFDTVQTANFPFWSVLAVRIALAGTRTRVVVDWFEIWSSRFWRTYAGKVIGTFGYLVQAACLRLSPEVIVLSPSNAVRLRQAGYQKEPVVLAGLLPEAGSTDDPRRSGDRTSSPYVLFAGRHINDKGVDLLPETLDLARQRVPGLRMVVAGDGPLRRELVKAFRDRGLQDAVELPGFVDDGSLQDLMAGAACVVVPSRREGYGFMSVDAMGYGTPSVIAAFPENLAVDHVVQGRNGFVADPPTPLCLAQAIKEAVTGGLQLRASTRKWYADHAETKTIARSLAQLIELHAERPGR
jgi:glycosyltransferase involved in cell wall biosynthesis